MSSPIFVEGKYCSVEEKQKVYKAMKRFASNKFSRKTFTVSCYKMLHLYFGFIAHYNIDGFYEARFVDDLAGTLNQIKAFQVYPALQENGTADICLAIRDIFMDHLS